MNKKLIIWILALMILLNTVTALTWIHDFEQANVALNGVTANNSETWTANAEYNILNREVKAIITANTQEASLPIGPFNLTDNGHNISLRVKVADTGASRVNVRLIGPASHIEFNIGDNPTPDDFTVNDGGAWVPLAVVTDNTWYNVTISNINYTSDSFNIILDGVLFDDIGNGYDFLTPGTTIDEIVFDSFNDPTGYFDSVFEGSFDDLPPLVGDFLNLSSPLPVNDSSFNFTPINFSVLVNSTYPFNCSLKINNTVNTTTNLPSGSQVEANFSINFTEGDWFYSINCSNNVTNETTINSTFFVDFQLPVLNVTTFINNTIRDVLDGTNMTGQWNFTDNDQLHTINVSIDGVSIFNETHIHLPTYSFNLTQNITALDVGRHSLFFLVSDGHTASVLKDYEAYNPTNCLFNDCMKYQFSKPYNDAYVKIQGNPGSWFDIFTTEYNNDRYKIIYTPNEKSSSYNFVVESDKKLYVYEDSSKKFGGDWLVFDEHWLDFHVPNQPDMNVEIDLIDDFNAKVAITGVDPKLDKLEFNSIGDLNSITLNYSFYKANMTENYDVVLLEGVATTYNLSVYYKDLDSSLLSLTPVGLLEINGTNYTTDNIVFNSSHTIIRRTLSSSIVSAITDGEQNHSWHYNLTNLTDGFLSTPLQSQIKYTPKVGFCNATQPFQVINMSYFDEISDNPLNLTNAFNMDFFDGTINTSVISSFTDNRSDEFCTNINSSLLTFNWDLTGTFTLSKTGYITRILEFDSGNSIPVSNSPVTNQSFFIIQTNESTTIVFNWQTFGFQPIDGTMRVYKCNNDGSRSLTESVAVTGGTTGSSSPSLQLLTQAYAYDIVIDGTVFEDSLGYSKCHIETTTPITYYVNIDETDISSALGLFSAPCSLTKASNTSVLMTWGLSTESTAYVNGCVDVYRHSISGNVNIFQNCSVETDGFSRTIVVPIGSGNTYTVTGHLEQANQSTLCNDIVHFGVEDIPGGLFGLSGIFATFLLILSLALMFVSEGEIALIASMVGVLISWVVGITNLPWIYNSALIMFLLIIVFIGRHGRKQE